MCVKEIVMIALMGTYGSLQQKNSCCKNAFGQMRLYDLCVPWINENMNSKTVQYKKIFLKTFEPKAQRKPWRVTTKTWVKDIKLRVPNMVHENIRHSQFCLQIS